MTKPSQPGLVRRVARALGPGLITGAADDDPSGIVTYSMAGAQHGMALLWLAWITWPLMAAVQMMCARIGMVTGKGLGEVLTIRGSHLLRPPHVRIVHDHLGAAHAGQLRESAPRR